MMMTHLLLGDCLEEMKSIKDHSVDLILTDPPYGTTACKWDTIIPFEPMWDQIRRVIKINGAIVLFSSQPFSSALTMSNVQAFKYEWIWVKNTQTGMMNAGKRPMKKHENVLVFSYGKPIFNEQKVLGSFISQNHAKKGYGYKNNTSSLYSVEGGVDFKWSEFVHANSVLLCNVVGNRDKSKVHPTQKPVPLMEYFINTYTNKGDTVLDFTMGSGTTGIACVKTERIFIGIEKDVTYFTKAQERIEESVRNVSVSCL